MSRSSKSGGCLDPIMATIGTVVVIAVVLGVFMLLFTAVQHSNYPDSAVAIDTTVEYVIEGVVFAILLVAFIIAYRNIHRRKK